MCFGKRVTNENNSRLVGAVILLPGMQSYRRGVEKDNLASARSLLTNGRTFKVVPVGLVVLRSAQIANCLDDGTCRKGGGLPQK
jgi:hypothetical protein